MFHINLITQDDWIFRPTRLSLTTCHLVLFLQVKFSKMSELREIQHVTPDVAKREQNISVNYIF